MIFIATTCDFRPGLSIIGLVLFLWLARATRCATPLLRRSLRACAERAAPASFGTVNRRYPFLQRLLLFEHGTAQCRYRLRRNRELDYRTPGNKGVKGAHPSVSLVVHYVMVILLPTVSRQRPRE